MTAFQINTNIIFDNIDILPPLSNISISPVSNQSNYKLPPPPDVNEFKQNLELIEIYLKNLSDGTFNLFPISRGIHLNKDNFRERLLYTLYKNNHLYNIISKNPLYYEWIKKVDFIKKNKFD